MSRLVSIVRVMRWAAEAGARDYASIFSWKSWLAGWYLRVLAQVAFFALIGRLLGSEDAVEFLLIGNAVMLAAMTGVWSLNMVGWERHTGTLPLLVASPSSPVTVFASRGSYSMGDGLISSLSALAVAGPLFGVPLPWPEIILVPPLTMLVALSAYAYGTCWGGVLIRFREVNNVVVNASILGLMTMAGVNVPVGFYPEAVQWTANVLPLTHGLQAIRDVLDGESAAAVLANAGAEALVGLGWLGLALLSFNRLVGRGRVDGSIEFGA